MVEGSSSADVVAKVVLKAVTTENPSLRHTGKDAETWMKEKSSMSDVEFYTKMEELMKQNVANLVRILTRRKCILKTVHNSIGSSNLFTRSIHNSIRQNFQILSSAGPLISTKTTVSRHSLTHR